MFIRLGNTLLFLKKDQKISFKNHPLLIRTFISRLLFRLLKCSFLQDKELDEIPGTIQVSLSCCSSHLPSSFLCWQFHRRSKSRKYVTHKISLTLDSCEKMLAVSNEFMTYWRAAAKMSLSNSLKEGDWQTWVVPPIFEELGQGKSWYSFFFILFYGYVSLSTLKKLEILSYRIF